MKKGKSKKIFSYILLIFIFNLIMPNIQVSANEKNSNYKVTIDYGIDGKYRAQKYMPIGINVENLSEDFNGEIEVRVASDSQGGYDAYAKEVNAKAGENINVSIPVKFIENSTKGTICLINNNKVVYEKELLLFSGRINDANVFTGLLTDDATALGYLGEISFNTSYSTAGKINTVNLNSDIIGNNYLNIDGLDLIIVNNYNMANLKKEQYDALNTWVNNGGTLLISAGANESKTINNIDKSFLNISSNGTNEKNVKLINESLNLILSSLNIDDANVVYGENGQELVYSKKKGSGEILITTFDIGTEPFISSKDASSLMQNILTPIFDKVYENITQNNYWNYSYGINSILNYIPVENILSTTTVVIILAIYAITVGIVLYLVLKMVKRRDLTWVILPVLAIAFTIFIYLIGGKMRVNDVILNSLNIISVNEDGKGEVNGYLGIGSKYKDNLVIEKDENLEMKYINSDNYYYGEAGNESITKLRVKTTYSNNNSYFTFSDTDASDIKTFKVKGEEVFIPKFEGDFNLKDGTLNGSIKNNLDTDVNRLLVVTGNNIWDLGQVKSGEEIKIENLKSSSTSGLESYSSIMTDEYYQSRWDKSKDENDPKYKYVLRYSNLLNVLSSNEYFNSISKIIAITDMPVEYGLNLGKKSVSKFNTTAIIQDIGINFKDDEGNINFPEGYFNPELNSLDNNAYVDSYNGFVYGQGEVIFDYKIDENIDIKEVTFKVGTDRWGYEYGRNGEYYIYNYKSNEYEKFLLSSGSYKVDEISNYTLNNVIKVKLEVNRDKEDSMAPKIVVKGVEK
ncbi:hypothetical protein [Clostridium celatum]|nr:hypothetical protein [Clostridium celatum]MCE9653697.1 hypothetical protein [Clostridium celatum]MDU2265369.1 hypothetical protein [Clostridium celatum]MDU6295001.1 hypothetical protein [Clostridium celatum]